MCVFVCMHVRDFLFVCMFWFIPVCSVVFNTARTLRMMAMLVSLLRVMEVANDARKLAKLL